jgi:hypothetical protein
MTNRDVDQLLAELAPHRDEDLERLDLPGEDELLGEILASPGLIDISGEAERSGRSGRPRSRRRFAVAIAAAAAVGGGALFIGIGSGGSPSSPEFAAAAIQVAQANPRLLVTLPGWEVTRADEFSADGGEMEFSDGEGTLTVTWYPAQYYDQYYRDRSFVDANPEFFDLLGERTRTVAYSDTDFATMLPPQGDVFVELRGSMPHDEYLAAVESLEPTGVDTWLAALPPSVVKVADRAGAVDEMLADVPLPAGFDLAELTSEENVLSRYHLGARVTGAVACAWLDQWVAAVGSGDQVAAREAVDAMATSHDWAILKEMTAEGAWSQVLWEYADAIRTGTHVAGSEQSVRETPGEFKRNYSSGLGCAGNRVG